MPQPYEELPGLAGFYLEDSWVLAIDESEKRIVFRIEAVISESNPLYSPPKEGEKYCYRFARLVFDQVQHAAWGRRPIRGYRDASGEVDYGNIDVFFREGDSYFLEGDWGEVRIHSDPPRIELE